MAEVFRSAQGNFSISAKKETSFFVLLSIFCNFAIKMAKFFALLKETSPSRQKKKQVSLFCSRLFVTLHPR